MKITEDFIKKYKTKRGGWRETQILLLGEPWPPSRGWIERAVGREISDADAAEFIRLALPNVDDKKKRERRALRKAKRQVKHAARLLKTESFYQKLREERDARAKPSINPNTDAFLKSYEWRRVRMEALKKYGARCQCCGATPADGVTINVDHIKPRRLFPSLALSVDNLQVLCAACNQGKGNWDMTDWREPEGEISPEQARHLRDILTRG